MQEDTQTQPEQSWKEKQKQQLKQELISVAVQLFQEKGFEAPSVDEITTRTGIAKGTFYLYFKTKSDIIAAILEAALDQLESIITNAMANAPADAPSALKAIMKAQASFISEHPVIVSLLSASESVLGELDAQSRSDLNTRLRYVTVQVYDRILRTGILQRHYREVDPVTAAKGLQAMFTALMRDAIQSGQAPGEAVEVIIDLFERGISRPGYQH
jgi:AcrR family transcriptional regulator